MVGKSTTAQQSISSSKELRLERMRIWGEEQDHSASYILSFIRSKVPACNLITIGRGLHGWLIGAAALRCFEVAG